MGLGRILATALVATACTALLAPPAGALERRLTFVSDGENNVRVFTTFLAASPDLRRILFEAPQRLTPDDDDSYEEDIYMWEPGTMTRVSPSPVPPKDVESHGSAEFEAASTDARTVAWSGVEHVVEGDEEGTSLERDVYVTEAGRTRLISTGPAAAGGKFNAFFRDGSRDLRRVLFTTDEALVPEDGDSSFDLYLGSGNGTILVSGTPGEGTVSDGQISADGRRVVFSTHLRMTATDLDDSTDVFEWRDGRVSQVSLGPAGGNGPFPVIGEDQSSDTRAWMSAAGDRIWFYTREALTKDDRDERSDLYERAGGATRRVSTGPRGGNGPHDFGYPGDPEADFGVLRKFTADGRRLFFTTAERLTRDDRDRDRDVYLRAGGRTTLVSRGGSRAKVRHRGIGLAEISADGRRAVLVTRERLTRDDTDDSVDAFAWREGGAIARISAGPRGGNRDEPFGLVSRPTDVNVAALSRDGRRSFFSTPERLTADDRDKTYSLYEHWNGRTTLVSFRNAAGPVAPEYGGSLEALSGDGRDLVLTSGDPLVSADRDNGGADVYLARLPSRR